jgi:hypothetical protein
VVGRRAPSRSPSAPSDTSSKAIQLPQLITDPVWSLKPWPVLVEVGDFELEIPAMCAADWLQVLMVEGLDSDDVFPGLLDHDSRTFIEDQMHDGVLEFEEVQRLALEIISTVSGRPWWVSLRLIEVARVSWDALGGDMAKLDATRIPLAGWLDYLFLLVVRTIDDAKRTMFLLKLEIVPAGWADAPAELEMSTDAFLAMASE